MLLPEGIFNMLWYFTEEKLSFSLYKEPIGRRKSSPKEKE